MLRRKKKPARLNGDSPLFRQRFQEIFHEDPEENRQSYLTWLQACGIDPVSGKMSKAGLALYKQLLEQEGANHRQICQYRT